MRYFNSDNLQELFMGGHNKLDTTVAGIVWYENKHLHWSRFLLRNLMTTKLLYVTVSEIIMLLILKLFDDFWLRLKSDEIDLGE